MQLSDDRTLLVKIHDELKSYAASRHGFAVVETAGGVLSPVPSGTTQADFYRPLRLPVLLIGDHRLGGIGSTISAWESLRMRGYDIDSVLLFQEQTYGNFDYLREYFKDRNVQTLPLVPPPATHSDAAADRKAMDSYYNSASTDQSLDSCIDNMSVSHQTRLDKLRSLPQRTHQSIWHPFMQHTERSPENILAIDSAYGDYFSTLNRPENDTETTQQSLLQPAFDGSASWWTQGLGHGNPDLALTAAYTAGRYGHVMFANAAHEPAVTLAETLLKNLNNPKLTRVFYSDNGSTGMEVAIKMALRASTKRFNEGTSDAHVSQEQPLILGLKGSYHGDTIGTMDCSEPSVYNSKVDWYKPRGYWLDFPQVKMQKGKWIVEAPRDESGNAPERREFDALDDILDFTNRTEDAQRYSRIINKELEHAVKNVPGRFGAVIMEPVILGAGGMMLWYVKHSLHTTSNKLTSTSDPLFQKTLVDVIQTCPLFVSSSQVSSTKDWKGLPIIFDEVFTGLYRLGRFSSTSFLQSQPDIAVHGKLLTGGLLPLCTTSASESIYEAFLSPDKSDALLHGHSYTAHPVGCNIALHSLNTMMNMEKNKTWEPFTKDWSPKPTPSSNPGRGQALPNAGSSWSMWSKDFVTGLSFRANVESVFALGSVLAITLKDAAGAGKVLDHTLVVICNMADDEEQATLPRQLLESEMHCSRGAPVRRRWCIHACWAMSCI